MLKALSLSIVQMSTLHWPKPESESTWNNLSHVPTLPHPSPGTEFNIGLLNTYYMPHNSNEWESQGPFQEFTFIRVVLTLWSLNYSWFSKHCQQADSKVTPFSATFHFQLGGHIRWVLAKETQLKVLRALGELSHLFASSCLAQKCNVWSCGRLSAIMREGQTEITEILFTALISLSYRVNVTNCLTPHSCHMRNISPWLLNSLLIRASVTCSQKYS